MEHGDQCDCGSVIGGDCLGQCPSYHARGEGALRKMQVPALCVCSAPRRRARGTNTKEARWQIQNSFSACEAG